MNTQTVERNDSTDDRVIGISEKPGNVSPDLQRTIDRNEIALSEITKKASR